MKKIPFILLLAAMMLTLTSWKTENGKRKTENSSAHHSPLTTHRSPLTIPSDTTKSAKDTTKTRKAYPQTAQDTSVAYTDTLSEVSVKADKNLRVVDVINKSLKNGLTQPRQKGISDIIGEKANDYIMHPFAWRERRKEKNLKKAKENIQKLDAAKTYEDELTEAINRQLREDSIAAAKKKVGERK